MKKLLPLMSLCISLIFTGCAAKAVQVKKDTPPQVRQTQPKPQEQAIKTKPISPPILAIDTGGHKAKIQDVIFTNDGKYLVSASDDKTVRIWNVATGKIERVIRGQIGQGHEGKIFAAALSPDNRWLAVGGYLGSYTGQKPRAEEEAHKIRLLNFRTGQITRLLKGHGDVIIALAFSPDSRRLISGSGDKTARIWDVTTGKALHTLSGHTDFIYAAAFSPDGERAVTGSFDDTLILWDIRTGEPISPSPYSGEGRGGGILTGHTDNVRSAAFTPDGKYLLSGSWDKTIRLWDGKSGRFIKELAKLSKRLAGISVSPDSKILVIGNGAKNGPFKCHIFSIPDGKKITTFTQHKNIVLATAISPNGRLAATGGGDEKEIYLWNISTAKVLHKLVGKSNTIWSVGFGKDGRTVAWGKTWSTRNLFQQGNLEQSFRLSESGQGFRLGLGETLSPAPRPSSAGGDRDYIRGIESAGDISIRTPNGKIHPTLQIRRNGKVKHEITRGSTDGYRHRSLTLTPDGRIAVSGGGNGVLASYDTATGKKLREFTGHTGDVWGVAVSPDGKWLVSGSADQTVKLWDLASGKNLLTIFHSTDNEWVAWTPEGFYTSSENGGRFVGYHINRGEDKAADYVRVEQIGKLFYRPDLVAKKLQGDEQEIRKELVRIGDIDQVLASGMPPKITVVRKPQASVLGFDHELKIQIENTGGGIGKIEYIINGVRREIPSLRDGYAKGRVNVGERASVSVPISFKTGKNAVEIRGWNEAGKIESSSKLFTVTCQGRAKPSLYVLAIGISTYYDSRLDLKMAHKDAESFVSEFQQRYAGLYQKYHPVLLTDEQATTGNIRKQFDSIAAAIKPDDVFVLYVAGHGKIVNAEYYFLPYELEWRNLASVIKGGIHADTLANWLTMIPAQKNLIILDTCYAGKMVVAMLQPQFRGDIEEITAIERLMRATGRSVIAGSSDDQKAAEGKDHGMFTGVLLKGLKGAAMPKGKDHGAITISDLAVYVGDEVPRITEKEWQFRQIPMTLIKGNFPIICAQGFDKPDCRKE
ncbi:caspase family protein [Desulfococcaceae bacterium HSG7]|nr:caspase family protein [Desulfococcaceae bacterium HSG7]